MKKVAVVGYGNTKFTKDELPIESLLLESTKQVFDTTKNLSQDLIDGVIVSTNDNSKYLGAILSELSGIKPKISHTVEHLCSSGSNAAVSGFSYIASGLADTVLVTGADKIGNPGQILEWDKSRGEFDHPIYWASMFTKAHKRQFSTTDEELAIVSAKNHKQAMDNPNAYSHKPYTISEIMNIKQNQANELLRQAHTAGFLSRIKKGRENYYTPTKKVLDIIDVSSINFTDKDFDKWYNENFSDKKYELVNP